MYVCMYTYIYIYVCVCVCMASQETIQTGFLMTSMCFVYVCDLCVGPCDLFFGPCGTVKILPVEQLNRSRAPQSQQNQ